MLTTTATESRAARTVREVFESGRPLTYVRTAEETRIAAVLREVGETIGAPVLTWSLTEGLDGKPMDARAVLEFIAGFGKPAIFHLKDYHEALRESAEVRRRVRDLYELLHDTRRFLVISSPVKTVPEEVERSLLFLELRPPDQVELSELIKAESGETDETLIAQLAPALQGLTLDEAKHAVRRGLSGGRQLSPDSLPLLLEEKKLLINRSGIIEFISDTVNLGEVGGLENLKKWLTERRKLFQMRDNLNSEIVPKGLLMMGIPGCGKSLCVKAIASHFRLPLYRIDMIAIFSGRYGKPEGAFVEACKTMEDMAPAVLWFDEIEMGITSTESSGEQGRIFAFFLTWMQEKTSGLFVAATANRIDLLPAEMIRKGRFDEVFFVDLPTVEERMEIFKIHLLRRGVDPDPLELKQLMEFTNGWTGAEIEQCVRSALTHAQITEKPIVAQDLINIAVKTFPLSKTMSEQISHIRDWAYDRAVRASQKR